MILSRRLFLQSGLAATAGVAWHTGASPGIEPVKRAGKTPLRISIAAYSYNKYLDLNATPKPTMTMDDFIDTAAELGVDAVEPTAYYFPEPTREYLVQMKGRCTRLGLDVSAVSIRNTFAEPDKEKLRKEIEHVKKWIEHTSLLGGKVMRIFGGRFDEKAEKLETVRARCIDALVEACDHAGKYGIFLAIEAHPGVVGDFDRMMTLLKAVKHDWLSANWDTGDFHGEDVYDQLAKFAPYCMMVQIKPVISKVKGQREPADWNRLIRILRDSGYRGYISLEYDDASEDPRTGVPKSIAKLKEILAKG